MKKTRNLWFMGVLTLITAVFSACGGSSNSTGADADPTALPTDGILGEVPKAYAEFVAAEDAFDAQYKELKETDPEKAKALKKEHAGIRLKFKKETLPALIKALEGKEIPVEVADGVPLKLDKNLTLDGECHATTTGVYTNKANGDKKYYDYSPIAYDSDGNPIACLENYVSARAEEGNSFNLFYGINIYDYNAAGWAHLKKIIIMDKDSEAFKQAEAAIKANKEAFKNKDKDQ